LWLTLIGRRGRIGLALVAALCRRALIICACRHIFIGCRGCRVLGFLRVADLQIVVNLADAVYVAGN
jgi:hypothetical protein